ncbi:hypothetical protein OH77DRAFT_667117 [Trametes cingulata]|nr:hypothetical protein OH77DRAFT_667117 [Trametes cingulata]
MRGTWGSPRPLLPAPAFRAVRLRASPARRSRGRHHRLARAVHLGRVISLIPQPACHPPHRPTVQAADAPPPTPSGAPLETAARLSSAGTPQDGAAEPSRLPKWMARHLRDRCGGLLEFVQGIDYGRTRSGFSLASLEPSERRAHPPGPRIPVFTADGEG